MDTSYPDAETMRLIRAFEAIADEQIRQAIIEIVQMTARGGSIEQTDIEVLETAHISPNKPS